MKIRSKLLIHLLPVFFAALLTFAGVSFFYTKQLATEQALNHLESVAAIQKQRIAAIHTQNIERLRLVAGRTQMRYLFAEIQRDPDSEARILLEQALIDALNSIDSFQEIALLNPQGDVLASTDDRLLGQNFSLDDAFKNGLRSFSASSFALDEDEQLFVRLSGPLYMDQRLIGVIIVKAGADNLIRTISDYTGLGQSGETTLAMRDEFGDAVYITPLRFAPEAAMDLYVSADEIDRPVIQALQGKSRLYTDVVDYRGEPVFAATQYLEATGWAVVTKIDRAEALAPVNRFAVIQGGFITAILFLVAVVSAFFANRLTQPIRQLQDIITRIEQGETTLQAKVHSQDEIAELAQSFNHMTHRLNQSHQELQHKIEELNQEIKSHEQTELALEENILKHKTIMETMLDGLIIIDDHGIVQSMNPAAEKMFGYRADEVIGWNVSMLMPETLQHHHDQYLHNYLDSGKPRILGIGREIEAKHKDGHVFPVEISVVEIQFGNKRIFSGVLRDLTEQRQTERLKQEFVAIVSHELRTPLTSIRGSLNLLVNQLAGKLDPKSAELLEVANRNSERLSTLINDLLDMEKLQTGRFELNCKPVDSYQLLQRAMENNQGYADKYNVKLELIHKPEEPLWVYADEDRIQQVLSNLLSNAIKFSPEHGTVQAEVSEHGQMVRFSIRDQGPGVPKQFERRIFQKFMQADSSDSRQKGGTGLGLAISKNIVELHQGQIGYTPGRKKGSCFFFDLPRYQHGPNKKNSEQEGGLPDPDNA